MHKALLLCLAFTVGSIQAADNEAPAALFQARCATCHKDPPLNRAPLPEALKALSPNAIVDSLTTGSMRGQGAALSVPQRLAIANWLSSRTNTTPATTSASCAPDYTPTTDSTYWNGWGADDANSRFQPSTQSGIQPARIPKLQLKWAFGFPSSSAALGQPSVYGGRLFFGSQDGTVYAADTATGCIFWTYKARATTRTAPIIATVGHARHAVLIGDTQANLYALDVRDGKLLWEHKLDNHPVARITGAPKLHGSRLYVPMSSIEEVAGGGPKYPCCTFRGSVVAVDIESGKPVWKTYTIPQPPAPTKKNAAGIQLYGPSGAAVWVSPTLDPAHRVLYIGTGNAYSDPPTPYSDAVIAIDMDSGAVKWSKQLAANDGWNFACVSPNKANCPEAVGPDVDIGASPILRTLPDNKRVLLVGQKSGIVHALDPDNRGAIHWQTRIGQGGALGGIQWGMAASDTHLYVALSDVHLGDKAGGLFALRIDTGEKRWQAPPIASTCKDTRGCTPAQMAPITATDGAVFSGSMDGMLRAYDANSGKVLWEFNTLRDFPTVNGVKAKGGSLSATGPVLANGMLFVNSGYGVLGGIAGNVLLAFAPSH
jgi:polyvinyl alcohol dehydrogenase (cytochrome)